VQWVGSGQLIQQRRSSRLKEGQEEKAVLQLEMVVADEVVVVEKVRVVGLVVQRGRPAPMRE
jgi:hypothetical protein